MFFDLFSQNTYVTPPGLYLFHQPNDLIVPYGREKLFASYSYCLAQAPFNCAYLSNTPYVYGSSALKSLLDSLQLQGVNTPQNLFENSNNTADCLAQYLNPSLGGHSVDNYYQRSFSMARFFADRVDSTCTVGINDVSLPEKLIVYPQPGNGFFNFLFTAKIDCVMVSSMTGQKVASSWNEISNGKYQLKLSVSPGIYYLQIQSGKNQFVSKIIVD